MSEFLDWSADAMVFERLIKECSPRLYAVCYRIVKNKDDAEDAYQEALLRAWRNFNLYDRKRPFEKWIFKIGSHTALDIVRQRRTNLSVEHPKIINGLTSPTSNTLLTIAFRECWGAIPPEMARIMLFRFWFQLTLEETCEAMNMTSPRVRYRLKKGCELLSLCLIEKDFREVTAITECLKIINEDLDREY